MTANTGGRRLREMRQAAGLTQIRLAGMVGASQAQIMRLEKGDRRLTFEWMVRLAQVLGREPADFFTADRTPRRPVPAYRNHSGNDDAGATGDFGDCRAFVWRPDEDRLEAVAEVNRIDISLLRGIDRQKATLIENTRRFAHGLPANNALLWGARGVGKSSLVKAVHATVNEECPLSLVEIHREDLATLPRLLDVLRKTGTRTVMFCDDLSFDDRDTSYKSLKAALEGGLEGRPANVLFYATSNRRHLMERAIRDNDAVHPAEAVDEKVSLSDRFGLWLGFHALGQKDFFNIVEGYAEYMDIRMARDELRSRANEWSRTRGARSGRIAWQFIQDLAGELAISRMRP